MRDVLSEIERWLGEGRRVALATVVETWGSAPRTVGSQDGRRRRPADRGLGQRRLRRGRRRRGGGGRPREHKAAAAQVRRLRRHGVERGPRVRRGDRGISRAGREGDLRTGPGRAPGREGGCPRDGDSRRGRRSRPQGRPVRGRRDPRLPRRRGPRCGARRAGREPEPPLRGRRTRDLRGCAAPLAPHGDRRRRAHRRRPRRPRESAGLPDDPRGSARRLRQPEALPARRRDRLRVARRGAGEDRPELGQAPSRSWRTIQSSTTRP